jgi:hypothetical protein
LNRILAIFMLMLAGLGAAHAQCSALPQAPASHPFLDRTNKVIISSLAVAVTGDALSTQKFLSRGYKNRTL